jgi:hypothetical protein
MKKKKEKKFRLDKEIKSLISAYRKKWNAMGERK